MMKLFCCLVFLAFLANAQCENRKDIIKDYVDKINEVIKDANGYILETNAHKYKPKTDKVQDFGEFDYVVIGAGTAGSIVASRLSETNKSVLLLEAGKAPSTITEVPNLSSQAAFSDYNWGYYSTPQKNACKGYKDNKCVFARGRGGGGSSLINFSGYSRFSAEDMKKLSDLTGYEWTVDYYKKSENMTQTNPNANIEWAAHGTNGPWHVENPLNDNLRSFAFREANVEIGQPLSDYNSIYNEVSVGIVQLNKNDGKRADTFTDFIIPNIERSNLNVSLNSYVIKVEINQDTKAADSVLFTKNNVLYRVKANEEVILSGGAVNSPQLLQLSGVGPAELLNKFKIPVIQDLPVGKNLRDHVALIITMSHNTTDESIDLSTAVDQFLDNKGVLTAASVESVAFYDSNHGENPDVELVFMPNLPSPVPDMSLKLFNFTKQSLIDLVGGTPKNIFRFLGFMLDSKSVGSVKIQSDDPFEYPLIDNNILSEVDDLEKLYIQIQIVRNLTQTEAFKKIDAKLVTPKLTACQDNEYDSKDYWFCVFRQFGLPGYHALGTCSLGKKPKTAVVDPYFKVYGIQKLRVADCSVLPFPIRAHTAATCAMVAEMVSDFIKTNN